MPNCAGGFPTAEILMGTGNLTELTDADSGGVTATLLGICSELQIRNVLVVQVSPHTRRTIEEHDAARRMMFAAREDASLPKDYSAALLRCTTAGRFPTRRTRSPELAAEVKDDNFRIETGRGRHPRLQPRRPSRRARRLFAVRQARRRADGAHAFYLGTELMKAEIAWRLGKRYVQDEPLDWGRRRSPGPRIDASGARPVTRLRRRQSGEISRCR